MRFQKLVNEPSSIILCFLYRRIPKLELSYVTVISLTNNVDPLLGILTLNYVSLPWVHIFKMF